YLSDVEMSALCGRTNTQSNTAFRGFGGPQGALMMEVALDAIARRLGKDPLDVRRLNFYGKNERNVTPYDQVVEDNVINELVAKLEASSDYSERRSQLQAFIALRPMLKKGLALTLIKFGISFNVTDFNHAGALVHIYGDSTVLYNHNRTELG